MFKPASNAPLPNQPFNSVALILLIGLYLLFGLTGFDPWRGNDATHFGPIYSMLQGDGWLFPEIAQEPFFSFPPLYYWVGSAFTYITGGFLPLHGGARLASAFFTALTVFFIAKSVECLYGRQDRTAGALLTMGVLGLVIEIHQTQPVTALMAMFAVTLYGLARVPSQPLSGSVIAGLGSGFAFLAGGVIGAAVTLPLFVVVMLLSKDCRTPRICANLLLGLSLALALTAVWPLAVHLSHPDLLAEWLNTQFAPFVEGPLPLRRLPTFFEESGWMLWPLWPLALWGVWRARRKLLTHAWLLPIAATVIVTVWLLLSGRVEATLFLLLIPPLALLATSGIPSLRRGAANAFDWFAVMTFGVFALLVWIGWTAQAFAWPRGLARHVAKMAPDYHFALNWMPVLVGVLICLLWLLAIWRQPRSRARGSANWAMGMTMLWCLAAVLLKPWFNHNRGYWDMAEKLQHQMVRMTVDDCIATTGMSNALRSSLYYVANIRTFEAINGVTPCSLLLIHGDRGTEPPLPAPEWAPIWHYQRGGDRQREVLNLYRRAIP